MAPLTDGQRTILRALAERDLLAQEIRDLQVPRSGWELCELDDAGLIESIGVGGTCSAGSRITAAGRDALAADVARMLGTDKPLDDEDKRFVRDFCAPPSGREGSR
jgi:hypothetical protein